MRRTLLAGLGGVTAASLGALCCVGPLIFVTFGVGAGLAATFEPLRPLFGVVMVGAFVLAFHSVYRGASVNEQNGAGQCAPDGFCEAPRRGARQKVILWSAVVLAIVIWLFPTWSVWLL